MRIILCISPLKHFFTNYDDTGKADRSVNEDRVYNLTFSGIEKERFKNKIDTV